jgi:CDP-diacylglycerol--glycerol-3-phosphate 3-phosphatidyltransferase
MEKNTNITNTSNTQRPFKNASLNNYFDFCKQNGPGFAINSKQIEILHDPPTFFNQLKERILKAEKHVLLASLYIGNEPKPIELVNALHSALRANESLQVTLLLDYLRGTRNTAHTKHVTQSSVTLLLPLLREFPDRVRCHFFHTPALHGVLKRLLPQRWNEVIGVQHVKCYIVDHVLCISGANLSEQYFTARQDRYMWLHSAALVAFYQQLIDTIGECSYHLLHSGELQLTPGTPDPATQSEAFKLYANQKMKLFLDAYRIARADRAEQLVEEVTLSASSEVRNNSPRDEHYSVLIDQEHSAHDTWIFPTIQMGPLTIDHDLKVTARVIQDAPSNARLYLTSPYFNFTDKYTQLMLESRADIQIIVASPEANGFWQGSGMSGYIPHAYSKVLQDFFNRVNRHDQQHRIELYEYFRNDWTFHAKGLWISLAEDLGQDKQARDDLPSLTMIGSPNFGVRSVVRDLESQLLIMTESDTLKQQLKQERDNIFNATSVQVNAETFDEEQRQGAWWVRFLIPLAKKYM